MNMDYKKISNKEREIETKCINTVIIKKTRQKFQKFDLLPPL